MGVIEKQSIQDIADAIRDRNGLTTLYKPRQMDEAIRGLYKTEAVNHIFDNLTISTTAQDSNITITDADTTKQAEITEIRGKGEKRKLPIEYQEVEYIETTGTQFTYLNNKLTNPIVKFRAETSMLFGEKSGRQLNGCYSTLYFGKNVAGNYEVNSRDTGIPCSTTTFDNIVWTAEPNKTTFSVNDNTYERAETLQTGNQYFYLFALGNNSFTSIAKMKYFKIYEEDTLIYNCIPCYRKSDGVIGLYDTVSNEFYTNTGTGTFEKGAEVVYENVTGDNNIVVSNKNLFEIETPDYVAHYAWNGYGNGTYTQLDNGYEFTERFGAIAFEFDNLTVGEKYTLSFNVVATSNVTCGVGQNKYKENTETSSSKNYSATTTTSRQFFTFTATITNRLAFNSGNVTPNTITITNIQLEKGEQDTTYLEHQGNSYRVDFGGKNIFNKTTIVAGDIRGQNTSIRLSSRQALWLDTGTYTMSTNAVSPFRYACSVQNVGVPPLSSYPTYILDSGWKTGNISYTFTLTTPGYFVLALSKTSGNITVEEIENFEYQLEKRKSSNTL